MLQIKSLDSTSKKCIADRPHGCNKQNKLFKEKFGLMTMMLYALELEFSHPVLNTKVTLKAHLHLEFRRMIKVLGFNYSS